VQPGIYTAPRRHRAAIFALAALFTGTVGFAAVAPAGVPAQDAATQQPKPAEHKHTHRGAQNELLQEPAVTAQPAAAPVAPQWPVNESPAKPEVTWDSRGLRIEATNASLHQILNDVSTATGAKVEGMGADERIFGEYGPGETRDVISQLLHGSGYNVLMIGDQGQGTPRQIILSARKEPVNNPAANRQQPDNADEDMPEPQEQEEPGPPQQMRPPPMPEGAPGAPRTPQQMLQELQQRQQQMQQMQQMQEQQQQQQQQPH
jgi:hypothetical protein